jgi:hypothetical protein
MIVRQPPPYASYGRADFSMEVYPVPVDPERDQAVFLAAVEEKDLAARAAAVVISVRFERAYRFNRHAQQYARYKDQSNRAFSRRARSFVCTGACSESYDTAAETPLTEVARSLAAASVRRVLRH